MTGTGRVGCVLGITERYQGKRQSLKLEKAQEVSMVIGRTGLCDCAASFRYSSLSPFLGAYFKVI